MWGMSHCRIPRPSDPAAAARAEVIELLFAYVRRLQSHFEGVAKAHDLTPMQAKVVMMLRDSSPMRSLADGLCCDPSNITGIVDRLEERGLLTRTEDTADRRVKVLQETPAGKKLRETFEVGLFREVPGMEGLSRAQVKEVRDALALLCESDPAMKRA